VETVGYLWPPFDRKSDPMSRNREGKDCRRDEALRQFVSELTGIESDDWRRDGVFTQNPVVIPGVDGGPPRILIDGRVEELTPYSPPSDLLSWDEGIALLVESACRWASTQ
jgi:hypothetical protein